MLHLFVQASKYLIMFLFLFYTFSCFWVFHYRKNVKEQTYIYHLQRVLMYLIHFVAFGVLYLTTENMQMIWFYILQVVLISTILIFYHIFYKKASKLVLNNMCMLLIIGFIMLSRLSMDKAIRQYVFLIAGAVIAMLIPVILQLPDFRFSHPNL